MARTQVVLVHRAGLGVAGLALLLLGLEPLPLVDGVVELAVGVGQLDPADDDLEPLGERRVVTVPAGQGRARLANPGSRCANKESACGQREPCRRLKVWCPNHERSDGVYDTVRGYGYRRVDRAFGC